MKIKEIELVNYVNALQAVLEKDVPGVLALAITRNSKLLESETESYNATVDKVIKKYAVVDENGNVIPDKNNMLQFEGENKELCNMELADIGEQEIEIPELQKVDMSVFENCSNIKAADIMRLDFMIK